MKRFFLMFALLGAVVGCSEDPQTRYAEEEQGDVSGEATPPMDAMMNDPEAMNKYAEEQSKLGN